METKLLRRANEHSFSSFPSVEYMRPLIDAHLDLAWSAMFFNRNLLHSVSDIRQSETGMTDELARGRNTVSLPELRCANVAVCIATLLARSGPDKLKRVPSKRVDLDYAEQRIAYGHAQGQLAYYRQLEREGHLRILKTRADLTTHWEAWQKNSAATPLGIILGMEGADPILGPEQVEAWWNDGLRSVGPVHYGRSQYGCGTSTDGPLSDAGVRLLKEFQRVGMILDVTHLSDKSFAHAMEVYEGPMIASHHNCRAIIPAERQLTDEQIKVLIQRDAVIGTAFDAWMLYPGWKRGETDPQVVTIEAAADHIDHICQLAGNTHHCAIGTDLDGGFGTEQTPGDLNTITDVHKLESILASRGYSAADVDGIFFGNWLRLLTHTLP
jgi:membrane dipeptidase